jgi:hypothetical protein
VAALGADVATQRSHDALVQRLDRVERGLRTREIDVSRGSEDALVERPGVHDAFRICWTMTMMRIHCSAWKLHTAGGATRRMPDGWRSSSTHTAATR